MNKILLLAAAMALIGSQVFAQSSNCAPREKVVERLEGKYSEGVYARGLASNGTVVEVWGSKESGTWTVTVTAPSGLTCLVASGESFETLEPTVIEGDPT